MEPVSRISAAPVWSRDGHELFYRGIGGREAKMVAAAVQTQPEFRVTNRTNLFPVTEFENATPHANYDVLKDGRFLLVRQPRVSELVYVLNWRNLQASANAPRR